MALTIKRALAWTLLAILVLATPLRFVLVACILVWLLFVLVRWLVYLNK